MWCISPSRRACMAVTFCRWPRSDIKVRGGTTTTMNWKCYHHKYSISRLVIEIVQNSFIYNSYILHINIVHWKHIWHTNYRRMWNSCDICSFIHLYFIHQHNYPCVKCVFNIWYSCVKCTNLWMNKFYTIFIINSSHVKFLMILEFNFNHFCKFLFKLN
jgi:hypothetical protein